MESPEIVTIRNQMRQALVGKQIGGVTVFDREQLQGTIRESVITQTEEQFSERLVGTEISGIESEQVNLHIHLANGNEILLASISGRIRYHETGDTLPKQPYLHLIFTDDTHLSVTVSLFACIRALTPEEVRDAGADPSAAILDPTSKSFTQKRFMGLFEDYPETNKLSAKKLITICIPNYIGGIGNGYLQPILYHAAIHPKRKIHSLTQEENQRYFRAIKKVIAQAGKEGGKQSERDLFGNPGGYVPEVGKETLGKPCQKCGSLIERFNYEGGACYVCPGCQPPP